MSHNEIIVIVNFLLYLLLSFYIYKKYGISVGGYLILLYMICSFFSILYVINPLYNGFSLASELTMYPYLFLFLCLFLLISPIFKITPKTFRLKTSKREKRRIEVLSTIIMVMQIICIALISVDVLRVIYSADLSASRHLVYGGEEESPITLLYNFKVTKLFDIILGALKPYLILISFYTAFINRFMGKKGLAFFILTITYAIMRSTVIVSRGEIVFLILYHVFILVLFKNYISKLLLKKITIFGISFVACFIPIYWAVSVSRFGDLATFFVYRYAGESMCNFNGLLFDNLKGTIDFNIYFPLFAIGQKYAFANTLEKWDLILNQSGVNGQFFYTIIGGFLFCFGKYGTMLFCLLTNRIYSKITRFKFDKIYKLLPICLLADMLIRGVFLFPLQGMGGNFEILLVLPLMYYLKK